MNREEHNVHVLRETENDGLSGVFDELKSRGFSLHFDSPESISRARTIADVLVFTAPPDRALAKSQIEQLTAAGGCPSILLIDQNLEDLAVTGMNGQIRNYLLKNNLQAGMLERAILDAIAASGDEHAGMNENEIDELVPGHIAGLLDWDMGRDSFYLSETITTALGLDDHSGKLSRLDFLNLLHPSMKQEMLRWMADAAAQQVSPFELPLAFLTIGGQRLCLMATGEVTDVFDDGSPMRVVMVLRKIEVASGLEQTRFAEILEYLEDAVFVLDADGNVINANAAVKRLYNYDQDEIRGVHASEIELFSDAFRSEILDKVLKGESWEGEIKRTRKNDGTVPVHARWSVLPGADGNFLVLGIERDRSERKRLESDLRQSKKLAKIGVLSEGIAHELRNPLSYSLSAAQLLDGATLPEDIRKKCLQTVTTGLRKAGIIVDNMLSLAKPQGQFNKKIINIANVIEDALNSASTHASFTQVKVTRHSSHKDMPVSGNHDMLVQVFHNVFTNAFNEMPEGGSLTISTERSDAAVAVRVTDTGPGVCDEQIKHLFDPFFTASSSGKGTGLGLTLSYYIMKEHDGSIEVESKSGQGATFVISFPVVAEA